MELFALGLILLMTWNLQRASLAAGALFAPVRRRFSPGPKDGTIALVIAAVVQALSHPSPFAQRLQAVLAQGYRLRSWRVNLMQACFADLGIWLWLLIAATYLSFGGVFVAASAGILLALGGLAGARAARLRPLAAVVFHVGVLLVVGESVARFAIGWRDASTGELATWLADNRPLAVLALTIAMAVFSAVIGFEGAALVAALVGLSTGMLSLNGAVAFVWGERLGLAIRLAAQARGQVPSVRRLARLNLGATAVAVPIAWLLLGFLRDFLGLEGGFGNAPMLLQNFVSLTASTTLPFLAAAGAVGHFAAKKTPDDLMERAALPTAWLESPLAGTADLAELREGLRARAGELSRLNGGFTEDEWKKVPPPVRQASEREQAHVQDSLSRLEAHLLSRRDFFGHQLR